MIKWSEEYRLGIDAIDEQHKHLVAIAERAYDVLQNNWRLDKYDEIVRIISELKEYTMFHFKTEEEYMMSIRYAKFLSHKVEHSDFVEKINQIDLAAVDANQEKYLLELLDFVSEWIVNHILKTDRLYISR